MDTISNGVSFQRRSVSISSNIQGTLVYPTSLTWDFAAFDNKFFVGSVVRDSHFLNGKFFTGASQRHCSCTERLEVNDAPVFSGPVHESATEKKETYVAQGIEVGVPCEKKCAPGIAKYVYSQKRGDCCSANGLALFERRMPKYPLKQFLV